MSKHSTVPNNLWPLAFALLAAGSGVAQVTSTAKDAAEKKPLVAVEEKPSEAARQLESMDDAYIRLNGKLSPTFPRSKLAAAFGKIDPKQTREIECGGYHFDEGSVLSTKTGWQFEAPPKGKFVGVKHIDFVGNNFITYKGQRLDASTTIDDLKKIFPATIGEIAVKGGEGAAEQRVYLPDTFENKDGTTGFADGGKGLKLHNGKLSAIDWFFPC